MLKIRKRKKVRGIQQKILTGYLVIILVLLFIISGLTYQIVRSYIMQDTQRELQNIAQKVATDLHRMPDWQEIRKYQSIVNTDIVFVGTDYVAVQSPTRPGLKPQKASEDQETGLSYTQIASQLDQKIIDSIFSGSGVTGSEEVDFLTQRIIYAGVPITDSEGELLGAMLVFRLEDEADALWIRITTYMLIGLAITVVIAIVFTSVFTKSITRPILNMTEVARKMADGNYSQWVQARESGDEIDQLAGAFNTLSTQLRHVICSLKNEKSKLEQILDSLGEGIAAYNHETNEYRHNSAFTELLELREDGNDTEENEIQKQHIRNMITACMKTGEKQFATWQIDSGRALAAMTTPIRGAESAIIGAVCLIRDVSEDQRLEKLRREYIANVSHELRTPLTGIQGMVEPLIDGILETEAEKNNSYQVIYKETRRLEKLIEEMLDLSRLQDGRVTVELEEMEIQPVLKSAANSMRSLAEAANIKLTVEDAPQLLCMGNENRVEQVLVILLDNAISFTPEGGLITLSAQRQCCNIIIKVKDTGVGIEPEHLPYIWERFYKADQSRMRTKGTGLGLAIAKRIVELMGGNIGVKTELGKGTEFSFTLKAVKNECRKNH